MTKESTIRPQQTYSPTPMYIDNKSTIQASTMLARLFAVWLLLKAGLNVRRNRP